MDRKICVKSFSMNVKFCFERGSLLDFFQKDVFGGFRIDGSFMYIVGEVFGGLEAYSFNYRIEGRYSELMENFFQVILFQYKK